MSNSGAVNDILARHASDVRAGATDVASFDDDGTLPKGSLRPGDELTGFAAPQHDHIVLFDSGHIEMVG
jgi:hypothetical protein